VIGSSTVRVLAILLMLSGVARAAPADHPRVALLKIDVVGLNGDMRSKFVSVLAQSLRQAGYDVMEQDAAQSKLNAAGVPPGCMTGPCLSDVGRVLGVQRVVVGGVGAAGSNYDITLTMLETQRGDRVAQSIEKCEICTIDEGLKTMGRAAGTVAQARIPEPAHVEPPPPKDKDIIQPPTPQPERSWYDRPAVRWTTAAVSAAAIGVGIYLLTLDGSCVGGGNPNGTPPCHDLYKDNAGAGWAVLGAGVAIGAGAVYLFWTATPEGERKLAVGWRGSF
jgi:hypothetical protein